MPPPPRPPPPPPPSFGAASPPSSTQRVVLAAYGNTSAALSASSSSSDCQVAQPDGAVPTSGNQRSGRAPPLYDHTTSASAYGGPAPAGNYRHQSSYSAQPSSGASFSSPQYGRAAQPQWRQQPQSQQPPSNPCAADPPAVTHQHSWQSGSDPGLRPYGMAHAQQDRPPPSQPQRRTFAMHHATVSMSGTATVEKREPFQFRGGSAGGTDAQRVPTAHQAHANHGGHPGCTMSQSTLRAIGSAVCPLCHQPSEAHQEYDAGLYQLGGVDGAVYGASAQSSPQQTGAYQQTPNDPYAAPAPPNKLFNGAENGTAVNNDGSDGDPGISRGEGLSVAVGWLLSAGLWLHLLIFIPLCESAKNQGTRPGACKGYYWQNNEDGRYRYAVPVWVVFGVIALAYLVHAYFSPTRRYLSNVLPHGVQHYVGELIEADPVLWWHIQCYHYVTETYTDSKGNKRTRQRRVNTHSATGAFTIDSWSDVSGAVVGPTAAPVRRLRSYKRYLFRDDRTRELYENEFATWVAFNDRDTCKEVSSGYKIEGFHDYTLAFNEVDRPAGFTLGAYWFAVFLTMSMPFRMYFFARTTPVDFHSVKVVGRN